MVDIPLPSCPPKKWTSDAKLCLLPSQCCHCVLPSQCCQTVVYYHPIAHEHQSLENRARHVAVVAAVDAFVAAFDDVMMMMTVAADVVHCCYEGVVLQGRGAVRELRPLVAGIRETRLECCLQSDWLVTAPTS